LADAFFDVSTLNASAKGFAGVVTDGSYVYFIPNHNASADGLIARYDILGAGLGSAGSWSFFDVSTLNSSAKGFIGAVFTGRYLYLVPNAAATIARYDVFGAGLGSSSAWAFFDVSTLNASASGFFGAVFDGNFIYFIPFTNLSGASGLIAAYNVSAAPDLSSASGWTFFDASTLSANAKGFAGGAYDGRYVYLAPQNAGFVDGLVARYDTLGGGLNVSSSWKFFDVSTVNSGARGFVGAAFDGKYVYFVPWQNLSGYDGVVARFDTTAPFATAASWSFFDTTTLSASAKGFEGSAFDGRYVYFAPNSGGTVSRFDARIPPGTPTGMPVTYYGSFY
jgi:hypothetical protein